MKYARGTLEVHSRYTRGPIETIPRATHWWGRMFRRMNPITLNKGHCASFNVAVPDDRMQRARCLGLNLPHHSSLSDASESGYLACWTR